MVARNVLWWQEMLAWLQEMICGLWCQFTSNHHISVKIALQHVLWLSCSVAVINVMWLPETFCGSRNALWSVLCEPRHAASLPQIIISQSKITI
jgi:hypothetical protein